MPASVGGFNVTTWNHTCSSGSDRLLIVGFSATSRPLSCAYDGVPMSFYAGSPGNPVTGAAVSFFYLLNPNPGTHAIVASNDGANFQGQGLSFTGVHQTAPVNTAALTTGAGSPVDINMTTTVDNCRLVGLTNTDTGVHATGGTNTTRLAVSVAGSFNSWASTNLKTPPGLHALQFLHTSAPAWAINCVALAPAPPPPSIVLQAAAGLRVTALAALSLAAPLTATATLAIGTAVSLSTAAAALAAAPGLTIGTAAHLTAPARLAAAAEFRIGTAVSFLPPSMLAAAEFRIGTRATLQPSPRETAAGITINGADVRHRVRMFGGPVIRDVLNDAPNTCTFTIEGEAPAVGQSFRITLDDGARVLFAGTIQTIDQSFELQPRHVAWTCTAIDDTGRANARRPFGTWVTTSATTIAAGDHAGGLFDGGDYRRPAGGHDRV